MAQKTSWTGAAVTQTDINTYLMGEGGAWTSWTPTCTQSFAVALTVINARYGRWGRRIEFYAYGTFAGNGASSNEILFTVPVTAAFSGFTINGTGFIYDVSGPVVHVGATYLKTTGTCGILQDGTVGPLAGAGGMTAAVVAGDTWSIAGSYEAAS